MIKEIYMEQVIGVTVTESFKKLAEQQLLMREFLRRLENSPKFSQDEYQALLFDLRDYNDMLSVVNDWVKDPSTEFSGEHQVKEILKQQLSALYDVINGLKDDEGKLEIMEGFGLSDGDCRRLLFALEGIPEVNRALQKEEDLTLNFDDPVLSFTQGQAPEKKGFFSRLFKK